jgi:hypothetical protein
MWQLILLFFLFMHNLQCYGPVYLETHVSLAEVYPISIVLSHSLQHKLHHLSPLRTPVSLNCSVYLQETAAHNIHVEERLSFLEAWKWYFELQTKTIKVTCHQQAYCSSQRWYISMENCGGMMMTEVSSWFIHQISLGILPAVIR